MTRPSERDWIALEKADGRLSGVPGLRCERDTWRVHLTHLPLLDRENLARMQAAHVHVMMHGFREFKEHGTTLRDHQVPAAAFARSRFGSLIGDEMRVGKTGAALAAHDLSDGQLLVVGPLASRGVWLAWMRRRWPKIEPTVLTGLKLDTTKLKSSPLIFVHYDILRGWQTIGHLDLGTVIFDEAHRLSTRKTTWWRGASLLTAQAKRRVIGLTGTPVWNHPSGLYNFLSLINPGAWGTFKQFSARYTGATPGAWGWELGRPTNEDEFRQRLQEVMIRRLWRDVAANLPPMTMTVDLIDTTARDRLDLDKHVEVARKETCDRALATGRATIGEMSRLRLVLGQMKMKRTVELAGASTGPLVIWCWHRDVAATIATALQLRFDQRSVQCIHGEVSVETRERCMDVWRADPQGILVLTIGVGQVAIDLSHAAHCIYAEQSWTPAEMGQSLMRIYDPTRPASATYVVADHWLDRRVVAALLDKCRDAGKLGLAASETAMDVLDQALVYDDDEEMELLRLFGNTWDFGADTTGDENGTVIPTY